MRTRSSRTVHSGVPPETGEGTRIKPLRVRIDQRGYRELVGISSQRASSAYGTAILCPVIRTESPSATAAVSGLTANWRGRLAECRCEHRALGHSDTPVRPGCPAAERKHGQQADAQRRQRGHRDRVGGLARSAAPLSRTAPFRRRRPAPAARREQPGLDQARPQGEIRAGSRSNKLTTTSATASWPSSLVKSMLNISSRLVASCPRREVARESAHRRRSQADFSVPAMQSNKQRVEQDSFTTSESCAPAGPADSAANSATAWRCGRRRVCVRCSARRDRRRQPFLRRALAPAATCNTHRRQIRPAGRSPIPHRARRRAISLMSSSSTARCRCRHRHPLGGQRRSGVLPAVAQGADHTVVGGRRRRRGNTSLNRASPVICTSGRTCSPGAWHVDQEVAVATVFRRVGVGAGQADRPVRLVAQRGPHLLPVQHPAAVHFFAVVRNAARSEPAPGSLHSWHPDDLAAQGRPGEAIDLLLGAVLQQRGTAQPPMARSGAVWPARRNSSEISRPVIGSAPRP